MSRHRAASSYGHKIRWYGGDDYEIYWTVATYVKGSRLRFPRVSRRYVDEAGARRFAAKWGVELPLKRGAQT